MTRPNVPDRQLAGNGIPASQPESRGRRDRGFAHGEALIAARDLDQDPAAVEVLQRLADATDSPTERADAAARLAAEALAELGEPGVDHGDVARRLIAAGLTLQSGVVDYDRLGQVVHEAYERGRGSLQGYDPSGG